MAVELWVAGRKRLIGLHSKFLRVASKIYCQDARYYLQHRSESHIGQDQYHIKLRDVVLTCVLSPPLQLGRVK